MFFLSYHYYYYWKGSYSQLDRPMIIILIYICIYVCIYIYIYIYIYKYIPETSRSLRARSILSRKHVVGFQPFSTSGNILAPTQSDDAFG